MMNWSILQQKKKIKMRMIENVLNGKNSWEIFAHGLLLRDFLYAFFSFLLFASIWHNFYEQTIANDSCEHNAFFMF